MTYQWQNKTPAYGHFFIERSKIYLWRWPRSCRASRQLSGKQISCNGRRPPTGFSARWKRYCLVFSPASRPRAYIRPFPASDSRLQVHTSLPHFSFHRVIFSWKVTCVWCCHVWQQGGRELPKRFSFFSMVFWGIWDVMVIQHSKRQGKREKACVFRLVRGSWRKGISQE